MDYSDQHANLVRMLEEQERFHANDIRLLKEQERVREAPPDPFVIHEPTIITGDRSRLRIDHHSRIDSFCKIEVGEGVWIGSHVHIASFCHLNIGGGKLSMQRGSCCASGVKLITGSNVPEAPSMSACETPTRQWAERGAIYIEHDAAILAGAIVLPNCCIGKGARVAAGAVVKAGTVIGAGEIWAGVPARRVK
jgi:acetyltransferase-like isoleucine patch superfamily enzyme